MSRSRLSTTGLGILGLLALRPFSAYELAQQIHRGLRYMQPASERNLYAEPKRLAAAGLVRMRREQVQQLLEDGLQQVRGYQADGGPFPERLHLIVLFARFYTDFLLLLRDWVALARREAASWPTTRDLGLTDGTRRMLQDLLRLGDQLSQEPEQAATGRAVTQGPPNGRAGADDKPGPGSLPV